MVSAFWYLVKFSFFYTPGGVADIYYNAGSAWVNQHLIYYGGFVYFPTSAAIFSIFSLLPTKVFQLLFTLLSISIFSWGIYAFCKATAIKYEKLAIFYTLLVSILLSQAALFSGQLHVATTGLMLLGFAALAREKWWQAAFWLSTALALKPTSIILFLLVLVLYPRATLKLLLLSLLFIATSFITQSPSYVATQYLEFIHTFTNLMAYDANNAEHWATLFGAFAFYTGHPINGIIQFYWRIIFAILTFFFCLYTRLKVEPKKALYCIFALGMCYLMLFNSRTENNDYIMIAPMLGYSLFLEIQNKKPIAITGLSIGIFLLIINWNLCHLLTPHNNLWLRPTVCVFYTFYLLQRLLQSSFKKG